ncbi:MAG TPA: carboxypeptidase M32 [Gemmatimonadales bacterium]|nr:carboxypeptidase M32 [Gemmatimonadales bacterium]
MKPEQAYQELVRLAREESRLASCLDLLEWDEEVAMPRGGVEHRAEQMALLAGLVHDRSTDPRYEELLGAVEASPLMRDPESPQAVNVRELRRSFDRERKKPRRLVEESARVTARASQAWALARERDDIKAFAPWLDRVFALAREEADAVGHVGERYQAFLDDYEPGMTLERLQALFARLETALVPLANSVRVERPPPDADVLAREFPLDRQPVFARDVAAALGFDLECGRLDVGQHPFCTVIGPGDIRVALRYYPRDFARGFFALLHETGHALYDQGLDPAHYGTPMGDAASPGLHESQSRLWENLVGRSHGFWRHFYPKIRSAFPEPLQDVSMDTFRGAVNRVVPGPIRAQADEVTYDLHIIIRFELERALLGGDLRGADLPGAWTDLYRRHLGVAPGDDRTGCLQDGHWSEGLIGYFPTYTLGNVYAAQLFAAAERAVGPLDEAFAAGDFRTLTRWLGENVYRHGRRHTAAQIVERATGSAPDPSALIASLEHRYRS